MRVSFQTIRSLILLAASFVLPAHAHDPSAWGGLFRSRDFGANWFPVDARDLFKAAPKLRASEAEIQQLLARCGFVL